MPVTRKSWNARTQSLIQVATQRAANANASQRSHNQLTILVNSHKSQRDDMSTYSAHGDDMSSNYKLIMLSCPHLVTKKENSQVNIKLDQSFPFLLDHILYAPNASLSFSYSNVGFIKYC
jgi:hypothetical protein